jgi:hypothetical protein
MAYRPRILQFSEDPAFASVNEISFNYTPDPDTFGLDGAVTVGPVADLGLVADAITEFEDELAASGDVLDLVKMAGTVKVELIPPVAPATIYKIKVGTAAGVNPYDAPRAFALRDLLIDEGF